MRRLLPTRSGPRPATSTTTRLRAAYAPDRAPPVAAGQLRLQPRRGGRGRRLLARAVRRRPTRRVFALLRTHADAVMVGAGTLRHEGYGAVRLGRGPPGLAARARARRAPDAGRRLRRPGPRPGRTGLHRGAGTADRAHPRRRAEPHAPALAAVADVVDLRRVGGRPRGRRWPSCAGAGWLRCSARAGRTCSARLLAADLVDELCLTLSPLLAGAGAGRIVAGAGTARRRRAMRLAHVLEADGDCCSPATSAPIRLMIYARVPQCRSRH